MSSVIPLVLGFVICIMLLVFGILAYTKKILFSCPKEVICPVCDAPLSAEVIEAARVKVYNEGVASVHCDVCAATLSAEEVTAAAEAAHTTAFNEGRDSVVCECDTSTAYNDGVNSVDTNAIFNSGAASVVCTCPDKAIAFNDGVNSVVCPSISIPSISTPRVAPGPNTYSIFNNTLVHQIVTATIDGVSLSPIPVVILPGKTTTLSYTSVSNIGKTIKGTFDTLSKQNSGQTTFAISNGQEIRVIINTDYVQILQGVKAQGVVCYSPTVDPTTGDYYTKTRCSCGTNNSLVWNSATCPAPNLVGGFLSYDLATWNQIGTALSQP